jgi:hypothetical protein
MKEFENVLILQLIIIDLYIANCIELQIKFSLMSGTHELLLDGFSHQ